jgi:uncharacterized protein YigA (DUF484 family)
MARRKQIATSNQPGSHEDSGPSPATTGIDGITGAQVADYLRAHPDFLSSQSDLLRTLTPPPRHKGGNVVDMQAFIIERLRTDHDDLLTTSRGNMAGQSRVHEAVLAFLSARSLEHLVHLVTTDLAVILGLDVVALCVESAEAESAAGVRVLPPGTVNRLLDGGHELRLDGETEADPAVYGGIGALVRSQALIRLEFGGKDSTGLLALGSREEGKFHARQGKELLTFLARVTECCVRSWLGRLQ